MSCNHLEVVRWQLSDGEPADLWGCVECEKRFVSMVELLEVEAQLTDMKNHFEACEKQRLEQLAKLNRYAEFFSHRLHRATIGGCLACPFPVDDQIHRGEPI